VRYALAPVLALVTAAMLAGCDTLAGITAWISHAPREELRALGCQAAPCGRTVTRILALVSPRALSRAVGAWLAKAEGKGPVTFPVAGPVLLPQVTCDGKEVRGARRPGGTSLFLLSAALTGTARRAASGAVVLADREIPAKTNEIPEIGPMLLELDAWLPLAGHVITADALCGRPHNASIVRTTPARSENALSSSRTAGISLLFASTATWPRTAPMPCARAATRCGAFPSLPFAPRTVLPSTAITSSATSSAPKPTALT
jgi:predicted small secreted protein